MAGLALFVLVTVHVATDSALSGYDPAVTARAVALRHPWLTPLVWLVTHLGGTVGLTALSLLVAAALAVAGRRFQAGVLLAAMAGSAALTVVLKLAVGRQRPSVDLLLGVPSSSFSFPSGHSFNTTVFVGALAGIVLLSEASRRHKTAAVLTAAAAALLMGLSRIYLAYHWLTDVLAGWSLGVAWLSLVTLLVLWVRRPRRAQE